MEVKKFAEFIEKQPLLSFFIKIEFFICKLTTKQLYRRYFVIGFRHFPRIAIALKTYERLLLSLWVLHTDYKDIKLNLWNHTVGEVLPQLLSNILILQIYVLVMSHVWFSKILHSISLSSNSLYSRDKISEISALIKRWTQNW